MKNFKLPKQLNMPKSMTMAVCIAMSLFALTVSLAWAAGPFTEVTNRAQNPARPPLDFYGLSGSPYSFISFVDIDGDGDQDGFGGHSYEDLTNSGLPFAFFKNVGTTTKPMFELETTSPFTPSFLSGATIAFADMDKDGDFDIFVGGGKPKSQISDRSVYFYRNTGSKTNPVFQAENSYTVPNNLDSPRPLLVDINGDGLVDMFVSSPNLSGHPLRESRQTTSGPVRYYQNNGTGFTPKADADNPLLGLNREEAICGPFEDVDRDGDFDVICGTSVGAINYWENKGTKTAPKFELQSGASNPFTTINVGLSAEGEVTTLLGHANPTFVDLNGDGNVDLVVGEQGGGYNYFENMPDPDLGFYWPNPIQKIGLDNPFSGVKVWAEAGPSFADVNGDGKMDMFVGGDGSPGALGLKQIRYWTNVGDTKNPVFKELTGKDWPFTGITNFNGGNGGKQVAFADFDKDGLLEAVVGGGLNASPEYWENIGTPQKPIFEEVLGGPTRGVGCTNMASLNMANPAIGDIDDDGDYDIIMGYYNPPMCLLKNVGSPTNPVFEAQPDDPISSLVLPSIQAAPALGDMDNDGDIDLLVGTSDGSITYFKNTGTKTEPKFTLQPGPGNPFKNFNTGSHTKPFIVDIDGDYDPDVFVGDVSGEVQYLRNDDPTPWPSPTATPTKPAATATSVPATATATATTVPGETATATTVPGETATATTVPGETATATTVPGETATATTVPGTTATATTVPSATATPVTTPVGPTGGTFEQDGHAFEFKADTFADLVNFIYQKLTAPTLPTGYIGIGIYYNASTVKDGVEVQPSKPYQVFLSYNPATLPSGVAEKDLALYYKNASGTWVKEASSTVDEEANLVKASPNHFSTWAVLATSSSKKVFLPLMVKK